MADRVVESTLSGATPAVGALGTLRRRAQGLTGIGLRPGRSWAVARFSLDSAMLITAGLAATLGASAVGVPKPPAVWLVLFAGLVLGMLAVRGMYESRLHYELLEDLRVVLIATSLAAMAVLSIRELISAPPDLSAQVIRTWAFATAYVAYRARNAPTVVDWSRTQAYRKGEAGRPTLIIGAGKVGRLTARRLLAHPEHGLKPIGFLDKDPLVEEDDSLPVPVLGASWDLDRVAAQYDVDQVIITFSRAPHEVLLRLLRRCEELGLHVAFVPRLYESVTLEGVGASVLEIQPAIVNFRKGSQAARYFLGNLADNSFKARMDVECKFINKETGQTIAQGLFVGEIEGGLFGGSPNQITLSLFLAQHVANFLAKGR